MVSCGEICAYTGNRFRGLPTLTRQKQAWRSIGISKFHCKPNLNNYSKSGDINLYEYNNWAPSLVVKKEDN